MSSTTILVVYPGTDKEPKAVSRFQNSWGTAIVVWDALYDKYVPKTKPYQSFLGDQDRLWHLYEDTRLELCERKVLTATYDHWYIRAEDAHDFHEAMVEFLKLYPPKPNEVNHLQKIADTVLYMADADPEDAFGFWWTSVADCPFYGPWIEDDAGDDGYHGKFDWETATDWGEYWRQAVQFS